MSVNANPDATEFIVSGIGYRKRVDLISLFNPEAQCRMALPIGISHGVKEAAKSIGSAASRIVSAPVERE